MKITFLSKTKVKKDGINYYWYQYKEGLNFKIRIYTNKDVMNLDDEQFPCNKLLKGWRNFSRRIGIDVKTLKSVCRDMTEAYWDTAIKDIIYDNRILYGGEGLFYLQIGTSKGSYDIQSGSRRYLWKIRYTPRGIQYFGTYTYNIIVGKEYKEMLKKEVLLGHQYENVFMDYNIYNSKINRAKMYKFLMSKIKK